MRHALGMRRLWVLVIGAIVWALAAWGALALLGPSAIGGNRVHVFRGVTTLVNSDGSAIGFRATDGQKADAGYEIVGAQWRDGGPWHDRPPTCLTPQSSGQNVTLGVMTVSPTKDVPGRDVVV